MNMLTCVATVLVDDSFVMEANNLIKAKESEGWYVSGDPIAIGNNLVMFTFKQPEQDELTEIPEEFPEDIDEDDEIKRSVRTIFD